ncbi:MAG: DUF6454 family protein [Stackebrandtia sp.]
MRKPALIAVATMSVAVLSAVTLAGSASGRPGDDPTADAFTQTSRSTQWEHVDSVDLPFDVHHPQGMVKVGDLFFITSVEIIEPTQPCPDLCDGYDRTPGKGVGRLYVVDEAGNLQADVEIGEGHMYHPGGLDYDGEHLWIPVAEYRPNSHAVVYRVDPETLEVDEAFRADDHVGGVVRDQETGNVHGVSWGSRTMYKWTPRGKELAREANPGHFVDYQDCDYLAYRKMLCGGVADLAGPGGSTYQLGGLALIDLRDGRVVHEAPVAAFSPAGHSITRNPVFLEPTADAEGLRLYAAPDDGAEGAILVYEAASQD